MKGNQRTVWLGIATLKRGKVAPDNLYPPFLCSLCRYYKVTPAFFDLPAEAWCDHPLAKISDNVSEYVMTGAQADCWGFRPGRQITDVLGELQVTHEEAEAAWEAESERWDRAHGRYGA